MPRSSDSTQLQPRARRPSQAGSEHPAPGAPRIRRQEEVDFPRKGGWLAGGLVELLDDVSRSRQKSRTEKPNGFANPLALI